MRTVLTGVYLRGTAISLACVGLYRKRLAIHYICGGGKSACASHSALLSRSESEALLL